MMVLAGALTGLAQAFEPMAFSQVSIHGDGDFSASIWGGGVYVCPPV